MRRMWHNRRGDTIVEVLIAIAVASAVLGTAYAITNRTVKSQQGISERAQAVKEAEKQLELLRINSSKALGQTGDFCFKPELKTSSDDCVSAAGFGNYRTVIRKVTANTFESEVTWPSSVGGEGRVSILYKVY